MESPREKNDLTPSQQCAVVARGNVLVMAGAGTGKTHTLVERCLDCLIHEGASLDEILVVTFTEAAATEMRQRLRHALENSIKSQLRAASKQNEDGSTLNQFCAEQLALFDTAHIGTLHSFCFKLVREHFYELGLDPQLAMLDEGEARLRAGETLDEELQTHYAGENELAEAVQKLIQIYGGGRDEKIRQHVLRLHNYAQTRPDADGWLAKQIRQFTSPEPKEWQAWLLDGVRNWREEWLPALENLRAGNTKADECLQILRKLPKEFLREQAAAILSEIQNASTVWPKGKKGVLEKPLEIFFADTAFLNSLAPVKNSNDPLVEDWGWIRGHMTALLRLAQNFSGRFAARKRDDGVLDFHDLEQFVLKLLWNFETEKPTAIAEHWREKLHFVFVDEYQDINGAQDKIISALSCEASKANRFLVGDVKQSIYRFRLADPKIFRDYAENWRGKNGRMIPLTENFRSRESLLNFVNSIFEPLMREEIGGVNYDAKAQLKFGSPEMRPDFSAAKDSAPRAELLLRFKAGSNDAEADNESGSNELADLEESEKEARLLALRLREFKNSQHEIWDDEAKIFCAVEWRDIAILLRAPSGKAEIFAKQFECAGIPLIVERSGFYDSSEVLDLLSVLQLLDNPLQDVPCIAVLRSPLVGLSLDELAQIRLAASGHFWFALNQIQNSKLKIKNELWAKSGKFLRRFHHWRKLAQLSSLSQCLEAILSETHYADWLKSRPRGAQRHANVEQFLNLAQKFDQFQWQGLFRFLKFIEAQREAEVEPEVSPVADENAVRLMSIHQSKGLEFPVVAVADLAKNFNMQDLRGEIIFDEKFGLCPRVKPPQTGRRYPSLPHWLAQQRQRKEQAGEELRLLYVAMTRARDNLILTGSLTEKKWETLWKEAGTITVQKILAAKSYADWLGLWFAQNADDQKELPNLSWRIADDSELAGETTVEKSKAKVELPELDDEAKQRLREVLTWNYGFEAATERVAKSSVTALRRQAGKSDDEAEQVFSFRFSGKQPTQKWKAENVKQKLSAADMGAATHKFLQFFNFKNAGDLKSLEAETRRLEKENFLSSDERAVLDLNALENFWNSEIGKKIRANTAFVKRELPFTAKFTPKELDEILGTKSGANLKNEFVVVQGVADLAVLLPVEIWIVDFKTDKIRADEFAGKIKIYAPQLKFYSRALSKIYSRPVTNCWLHFLSARRTIKI